MADSAGSDSKTHTYEFDVTMTCSGCSGAVDRVLKRLDGLESYNIDQENHYVVVKSASVDYDTVLEKIKKTGKKINSGKMDDQTMAV